MAKNPNTLQRRIFTTKIEDAPPVSRPVELSAKTRAEMEAGREALKLYAAVPSEPEAKAEG